MGLWFKRRPFLDDERVELVFETWSWWLRNFGGFAQLRERALVTPTDDYFPVARGHEADVTEELFQQTRRHVGLSEWPCVLELVPQSQASLRDLGVYGNTRQATLGAGFRYDRARRRGVVLVEFEPTMLPERFVAGAGFGLVSYLLSTSPEAPPSMLEALEVGVAFAGLGIFWCNVAVRVHAVQDDQSFGFSTDCLGWLEEPARALALAIFTELLGMDPAAVRKHLRPNGRKDFAYAVKALRAQRQVELAALREIAAHRPYAAPPEPAATRSNTQARREYPVASKLRHRSRSSPRPHHRR